jgi:hypothetical protein
MGLKHTQANIIGSRTSSATLQAYSYEARKLMWCRCHAGSCLCLLLSMSAAGATAGPKADVFAAVAVQFTLRVTAHDAAQLSAAAVAAAVISDQHLLQANTTSVFSVAYRLNVHVGMGCALCELNQDSEVLATAAVRAVEAVSYTLVGATVQFEGWVAPTQLQSAATCSAANAASQRRALMRWEPSSGHLQWASRTVRSLAVTQAGPPDDCFESATALEVQLPTAAASAAFKSFAPQQASSFSQVLQSWVNVTANNFGHEQTVEAVHSSGAASSGCMLRIGVTYEQDNHTAAPSAMSFNSCPALGEWLRGQPSIVPPMRATSMPLSRLWKPNNCE